MDSYFAEMYGGGGDGYDMMAPDDPIDYTQTLEDLYHHCMIPNISGVVDSVTPLLIACLVCCVIGRLAASRQNIVHCVVTVAGALVLYKFFALNSLVLGE